MKVKLNVKLFNEDQIMYYT